MSKIISKKEILQDLDILQTNAVEGVEETPNTLDSQKCIDNIREYISQYTADKIVKELLSKPYKVIYDYEKGFTVQLYGQELYVSNKFAIEFESPEDSRSSILLEYGNKIHHILKEETK